MCLCLNKIKAKCDTISIKHLAFNFVEFMPKKLCDNFSKPLSYV